MVFLSGRLKNEDIICISTSDWEKPYGSRQRIMSGFAEDNRVLFVEAQSSCLHLIKNPKDQLKRVLRWLKGISRRGKIILYTPAPLLPFGNYFFTINRINQKLLSFSIKRAAKKIGIKNPLLWIYSVNSVLLLGAFGEKFSIYYCIEDFFLEKPYFRRQRLMYALEEELLKKADMSIACTKSLWEDRRFRHPNIYFLRNGVDSDMFNSSPETNPLPFDLASVPQPRIGFMGTLDSRIDTELLLFLAQSRKSWNFILIGSNLLSRARRAALRTLPNVLLLGFKPHRQLAGYISAFSTCLIPYHTNKFSRSIFPIKTLEYLASGKPVVSTNLPELEELKSVVYLSRNKEEFLSNLEKSLEERGQETKRKNAASGYAWQEKVDWLSKLIAENMAKKELPDDYQCAGKNLF